MSDEATTVEETTVAAEKKAKAAKPKAKPKKSKAKVSNTAKIAPKKSAKERKKLQDKAHPKKPTRKRSFEVEGEKEPWPRNKVLTLLAIQKLGLKAEVTKVQIIEKLLSLGYKKGINADFPANKFCFELQDEGYCEVGNYEGDRNNYRQVTAKGMKIKLPSVPVE